MIKRYAMVAAAAAALLFSGASLASASRVSVTSQTIWSGGIVDAYGVVRFPYGIGVPKAICEPFYVCDLVLQPGEHILSAGIGDSVRWQVQETASGPSGEVSHLFIKPTAAGLVTNLVVNTDLRTYNIELRSSESGYHRTFGFYYSPIIDKTAGEQSGGTIDGVGGPVPTAAPNASSESSQPAQDNAPQVGIEPNALDFAYQVDAPAGSPFVPVRVYNDGVKTYVQMPTGMTNNEAPIVMTVGDGQDRIVNYRLDKGYFVIDGVPSKIALLEGSSGSVQRVTITRNGQ